MTHKKSHDHTKHDDCECGHDHGAHEHKHEGCACGKDESECCKGKGGDDECSCNHTAHEDAGCCEYEKQDDCECGHEHVKTTKITPVKKNTSGIAEEGNVVRIHYVGTLDDGEEFDSSKDRDPLEFSLGSHSVIPGFENAIVGMRVGEKKKISLAPKDAYGEQNDELRQTVPREALGEITPEVGMMLALQHPAMPHPMPARVAAVTEEEVTLDLNHPLAGKTLHFTLELVELE